MKRTPALAIVCAVLMCTPAVADTLQLVGVDVPVAEAATPVIDTLPNGFQVSVTTTWDRYNDLTAALVAKPQSDLELVGFAIGLARFGLVEVFRDQLTYDGANARRIILAEFDGGRVRERVAGILSYSGETPDPFLNLVARGFENGLWGAADPPQVKGCKEGTLTIACGVCRGNMHVDQSPLRPCRLALNGCEVCCVCVVREPEVLPDGSSPVW